MSRWAHWSSGTEEKGKSLNDILENMGNPSAALGPAERARQLGLQSNGKGGYIDPNTGQVVARTVNNELIFYDNNAATGGAISDGSGGAQLTQAQPSWADPLTGMLTTPPSKAETPSEIAAIPDPTPATAPFGYNAFMKQKKMAAYQQNAVEPQLSRGTPDEIEQENQMAQQGDPAEQPAFAAEDKLGHNMFENLADNMAKAYERNKDKIKAGEERAAQVRAQAVDKKETTPQGMMGRLQGLPPSNMSHYLKKAKDAFNSSAGQTAPQPDQKNTQTPAQPSAVNTQSFESHPSFQNDYPTTDEDFASRLRETGLSNGSEYVDLGGLLDGPVRGINQKYLRALSRGLAARKSSKTKDWGLFSEGQGGGAGENASRFGELMSLIFSSADDEQSGILEKAIRKSLKSSKGNSHVDESWLDAALQNRTGIQRLLKFENEGESPTVAGGAWDVPGELEALGIGTEDGEKKGFSTDMVTRDSNGRNYQVSLKKGGANRLLNSTAANYGQFIMDGIREHGSDEQKQLVQEYDDRREDFNGIYKAVNGEDFDGTIGSTPSLSKIKSSLGVSQEEARKIRDQWNEFKKYHSEFGDQFVGDGISSKKFIEGMNADLLKGIEDNREELLGMDMIPGEGTLESFFQNALSENEIDLGDLEDRFMKDGKVRTTPLGPRKGQSAEDYARIKGYLDQSKTSLTNQTDFNEIIERIQDTYPDMSMEEIIENLTSGSGSQRDKNKMMFQLLANTKNGQQFRDSANQRNRDFTRNAMSEISNNPLMRSGVLQSIRKNFPLRDVADGSESMVIGDSALSKRVLKEMFGTDDYENIKDNLQVVSPEDDSDPYLAYKALVDPMNLGEFEDIPIADVGVRQDGVGYGPTIKHEMTMRKDFFERLQEINKKLDTSMTTEEFLGIVFNRHMVV